MGLFVLFFGFYQRFLENPKNLRENQQYIRENQRKPKKTKQPSGKQIKHKVFKGFRPTLGHGCLFIFCWFSRRFFRKQKKTFGKTNNTKDNQRKYKTQPSGKHKTTKCLKVSNPPVDMFFGFSLRFLENQKNIRENQKYKRKPKNTQKTFGTTKLTNCLKVADPPLDMGLLFFVVWFSESRRFLENKNNFRENQTYKRKPTKTKTTFGKTKNKVFKGCRPTLGYGFVFFVLLVLPNYFLFFWCSLMFFWFSKKPSGKPNKTYPRVGLKPLKTLFFWFSRRFFWFSLVFFGIFDFPEGLFGVLKTFGKTKTTKKTNPYPRVGLQPLKTLLFWFSQRFFGFLWFSFVFVVFPNVLLVF